MALAQAQPADARRQALESDAFSRPVQPTVHAHFLGQTRRLMARKSCAARSSPASSIPTVMRFNARLSGWPSDAKARTIAGSGGASVVICPSTEGNLGDGLIDLPGWLTAGVPITGNMRGKRRSGPHSRR